MVKYQGNVFYANFWAAEPGVGNADDNGWRFYDELYDQTPHSPTTQANVIAYIPTWRKKEEFNHTNGEPMASTNLDDRIDQLANEINEESIRHVYGGRLLAA